MQRVKYTNPRGESVIFGLAPPFVFNHIRGTGAMEAEFLLSTPASIDGETIHDVRIKPRTITLTIHIEGGDREDLYTKRQQLMALLNPMQHKGGKLGKLEYANDRFPSGVWIPAVVKKGPSPAEQVVDFHPNLPIVFECPDPLWRSHQLTTQRVAYLDDGFEFPLEMDSNSGFQFGAIGHESDIYNEGDSPAPLILTIIGPAREPGLRLLPSGEFIRVKRDLAVDDILTIDTTPGHRSATIVRANGSSESAMGYIDLATTWIQLQPGLNKAQFFAGDESRPGTISTSHYDRYGGV